MFTAKVFSVAVVMAVSLANLKKPLLFCKVLMKLISFAELFVVGRCFNGIPAVAAQMVDYQRSRQCATYFQNI